MNSPRSKYRGYGDSSIPDDRQHTNEDGFGDALSWKPRSPNKNTGRGSVKYSSLNEKLGIQSEMKIVE